MRVVIFCHSLRSDWNHGNAHFLRGVCAELIARGHDVRVFEPADGWSATNLAAQHGPEALAGYRAAYPDLASELYDLDTLDLDEALDGARLVLVHEWNDHQLVQRIGEHRARTRSYVLLFHDTHHRSVTAPDTMQAYDLRHYDGVLAFGRAVRDVYIERAWTQRAWVWHEAADTRLFRPLAPRDEPHLRDRRRVPRKQDHAVRDLVWIGNWGDDERTRELREFLIEPAAALKLRARVHGVRYPEHALSMLAGAGMEYGGWIPNHLVPGVFAKHRVTVHVPRGPYVRALPGVPTIRVFEALACGIPLICSPWEDAEGLFEPGDYLVASTGTQMKRLLRGVIEDDTLSAFLSERGVNAIRARHTCSHRVDELLAIVGELRPRRASAPRRASSAAMAEVMA